MKYFMLAAQTLPPGQEIFISRKRIQAIMAEAYPDTEFDEERLTNAFQDICSKLDCNAEICSENGEFGMKVIKQAGDLENTSSTEEPDFEA